MLKLLQLVSTNDDTDVKNTFTYIFLTNACFFSLRSCCIWTIVSAAESNSGTLNDPRTKRWFAHGAELQEQTTAAQHTEQTGEEKKHRCYFTHRYFTHVCFFPALCAHIYRHVLNQSFCSVVCSGVTCFFFCLVLSLVPARNS